MLILLIAGMLSRYGFEFEEKDAWNNGQLGYKDNNPSSTGQEIRSAPLYITLSGNIYVASGTLENLGFVGHVWSATTDTQSDKAYYIRFYTDSVFPTYPGNHFYGPSLPYYMTNFELLNYLIVDRQRRK